MTNNIYLCYAAMVQPSKCKIQFINTFLIILCFNLTVDIKQSRRNETGTLNCPPHTNVNMVNWSLQSKQFYWQQNYKHINKSNNEESLPFFSHIHQGIYPQISWTTPRNVFCIAPGSQLLVLMPYNRSIIIVAQ